MKIATAALGFVLAGVPYGCLGADGVPPPAPQKAVPAAGPNKRAAAYYNFAMGRLYEERYEETSHSEDANLAIEHYKKAYELDPRAGVIGERLAEMYAKSQRIRDAVLEAQEILKRDPDNVAARRLLARIYLRTLGDLRPGSGQRETVTRAIEQFREILRIEPGDTEAALKLARLYRIQNEHEKAEDVLRGVLAREPANESALVQLTQLLLDLGKKQEAIALAERGAKHSPTAALVGLEAEAYAQAGEYAKAEQAYRRALDIERDEKSGEAPLRRGLAQALLAQHRYEGAIEQFERLSELEPDAVEHSIRLTQLYRRLKKFNLARQSLERAREREPANLEVAYHQALLEEAEGRFDDAIGTLSSAVAGVKARPGRLAESRRPLGILYEQLGRLYREVENYSAAILTFREMQKLGVEEEQRARQLVIDTLRLSKDLAGALDESRQVMESFPDDRSAKTTHALLLGEQGSTDQAATLLRRMLKGTREDREIQISLAQVYERGRRFAEAEEALNAAEKLAGGPAENEVVWYLRGAVYERQKKIDLAEAEFKKVLETNPRNAGVLNYFGYMLAEAGVRLDEAEALVKRALEEEANSGAYLDSLGWAYFKQNRLREAEEFLRRAVARSSRDPTIREHLGDVLHKTGRVQPAVAEWEKALAEWRRSLPTEYEAERVAAIENKLSQVKQQLASKSTGEAKPK